MDSDERVNSNTAFYPCAAGNANEVQLLSRPLDSNERRNYNGSSTRPMTVRLVMDKVRTAVDVNPPVSQRSFQVFVAKYNYDPVQFSPNDNPEAELALTAGDYLFIYGEMDEDGYYEGELMNGHRGVVPSNFIERVPEEELKYLHSAETENQNGCLDNGLPAVNDVEDVHPSVMITELLDSELSDVPYPRDLRLERQLTNSCVVTWSPPEGQFADQVESYKVFADGQLVSTIKACDRTKALIEKIDASKSHKISVRAISKRGESTDHQCAITVGKGNRLAPSAVDVADITKSSANVLWTSASSYIEHVVSVDGQWETVTRPGVHQCLITGLLPSVTYTVSITCVEHQHLDHYLRTASLSFVTLPKDFPDPPDDIQVEAGPQQGTLLVTWSPVINSGLVTGYCIYANGTKVKELTSPTGDHVVLDCVSLLTVCRDPRLITVRTSTLDCRLSHDSSPVVLSQLLIEEIRSSSIEDTKPTLAEKDKMILADYGQKDTEKNMELCEGNDRREEDKDEKKVLLSRQQGRVPQIEITKDSLSDSSFDNYSEQGNVTVESDDTRLSNCGDSGRQQGMKLQRCDEMNEGGNQASKNLASCPKPRDYFNRESLDDADRSGGDGDRRRTVVDNGETGEVPSPVENEPESLFGSTELEYSGCNDQVKIFIALFEYNPATMSPNSGAIEEELPFSEGQLIKVFGEKDVDGFYLGEANGLRGLVPCNMVSEVQIDNPDLAEQLIKESMNLCHERSRSRTRREHSSKPHRQTNKDKQCAVGSQSEFVSWSNMAPSAKMVALYDYNPHESSQNIDEKLVLSFKAGDVITVFGDVDYNGFYHGEVNNRYCLVPSNFLQPYSGDIRSPHHFPSPPKDSSKPSPLSSDFRQNGNHGSSAGQKQTSRDSSQKMADVNEQAKTHHHHHGNHHHGNHVSSCQTQKRERKFVPDQVEGGGGGDSGVGKMGRRNESAGPGRAESQRHKRT